MLARGRPDLDRWTLAGLAACLLHIYHHAVEFVEVMDIREVFSFAFVLQMRFGMRGRDDWEVSTQ